MDSIKKSADFKLVSKLGDRWVSDSFIIQVLKKENSTEELQKSRIGLIVSKKLGNAVRRNLIKRRFREVARICLSEIEPGFDIVIVGRLTTIERSFEQLVKDMRWSFKRLGISLK